MNATIPAVLTVAGSDSGGGAGVQADLKTFAALEVYGLSAITAVTAQSTVEVRGVHAVPSEHVRAQIEAVLDDFDVRVIKTGMLWSRDTIDVVAETIASYELDAIVDPVIAASSGAELLPRGALDVLLTELVPRARLVTPNIPEIEAMLGVRADTFERRVDAARALVDIGAPAVLLKGGHAEGPPVDVLVERDGAVHTYAAERVDTVSTHGTGCTYAAAIAAYLARGLSLAEAVEHAHRYLQAAIRAAPREPILGHGKGPVHHLHPFYQWPAT
jgi:hydroxymethylpyrimidine/phosphomethylpyrimidine kinase